MDNNTDHNRSIIQFGEIVFRDINEFVIDLKNHFTQMTQLYREYKLNRNTVDKEKLKKQTSLLNEQLEKIQNILTKKLKYITDENQVDQALIGDIRPKLIQLKTLNQSSDVTLNPEENVNKLVDFFSNRVLVAKVAITGKIFPHKKK